MVQAPEEHLPALFWFRRDLRLHDNAGLYHALRSGHPVQCLFIFDTNILDALEDRDDSRVSFIHETLCQLNAELKKMGAAPVWVFQGQPAEVWSRLLENQRIQSVYCNEDYEPYARSRDAGVAGLLNAKGITFHGFKDQVLLAKDEVLKDDGRPYTVFSPYKRRHLSLLSGFQLRAYPNEKYARAFSKSAENPFPLPSLASLGFTPGQFAIPPAGHYREVLSDYGEKRNFPHLQETSRAGIHLRFGTLSIRQLAREAMERKSEVWLGELIWRDFYFSILWHFPHVVGHAFKPEYDQIRWRNNEEEFKAWQEGRTGFPLVDAGMRQLSETGYMHNRVRMLTASFLTKDLLIDWRWGEAWFARKLLDYDLAANNGGWQWAAGTGCDAAPYFRIFNPAEQLRKFDSKAEYVRRWLPEFDELTYSQPIVDHKLARERCLKVYREALNS